MNFIDSSCMFLSVPMKKLIMVDLQLGFGKLTMGFAIGRGRPPTIHSSAVRRPSWRQERPIRVHKEPASDPEIKQFLSFSLCFENTNAALIVYEKNQPSCSGWVSAGKQGPVGMGPMVSAVPKAGWLFQFPPVGVMLSLW